MTNTVKYDFPKVGCYIDESAGGADACNERTIKFAEDYGFDAGEWQDELDETSEDYGQELSEIADNAVEFLNGLETRSFMYWQFEDNSLYLMVSIENAQEDVGFISSKDQEYPADDYEGEWLHVSDHGNATLYVRENGKDREIWGVV